MMTHAHRLLVAAALAVAACARQKMYRAGDSMVPTIAVGTRVAVEASAVVPLRGRVVVFRAPERPEREYVKRIIGLPGDTISSNGTELRVNGTPVARCRIGAFHSVDASGAARAGELWLETLDGASWLVFHSDAAPAPPAGPWLVPPGEVFVVGDSRENSHDSRFWNGGKGGGLPLRFVVGAVTGINMPILPAGAEALEPGLARCRAALGHS